MKKASGRVSSPEAFSSLEDQEVENKRNFSILMILLMLSLLFSFVSPQRIVHAANLQAIEQSARFGGKFYAVKVFYHTGDGAHRLLAGTESGFQIYDGGPLVITPNLLDDYPDSAATYGGGASGLGIPNFKSGVDGITMGAAGHEVEYAFYADGKYLYALNIHHSSAITEADSVAINNVRAVRVFQIGPVSDLYWYAFALAYQSGAPGTTMLHVYDVDDPTDMTILGTLDLDKDAASPNNTGGCAMDYVTDLDNDGTPDDPYLFIADGAEGIKAVDLSGLYTYASRTLPTKADVTFTNTDGIAQGIDVVRFGSTLYAFVADGAQGLKIFDVTDPADMPDEDSDRIGAIGFTYAPGYSGQSYDVKLFGTTAFVANGLNGVQVVDVSDPANPVDITMSDAGSYIDSTGELHRLNAAAYSVDLDIDTIINLKLYPVVAWGKAGLIKTDIGLDDIDIAVPGAIVDYIYDGTYIWIRHTNGKLSKFDPDTMDLTTSGGLVLHAIGGNIVSIGDYIYGIKNGLALTEISRVSKSTLTVTGSSADGDMGDIVKLFKDDNDSTFLYYLTDAVDDKKIGKLNLSNLTKTMSPSAFYDSTDMIILGNYIYAIDSADATIVRKVIKATLADGGEFINFPDAPAQDVAKFATDGTYGFCVNALGKLTRWNNDGTNIITTGEQVFAAAASQPLFIQGGYAYGRDKIDDQKLARVNISRSNFTPDSEATTTTTGIGVGSIFSITGDGQDIYLTNDTTGKIAKIAVDRWGNTATSGGDGIQSPNLLRDSEEIIAVNVNVFGADGIFQMHKVSFYGAEATHSIATITLGADNPPHIGGYAKDLVLYSLGNGDPDYIYLADGPKGIVRFTVTAPSSSAGWDAEFLTNTNPLVDGDVTDDWDIKDARGIDVALTNTLVLVADGAAGVKLVNPNPPDDMSLQKDGPEDPPNGYITQAQMGTSNGTAEDITYFTFNTHDYAAVANGAAGVVILDLNRGGNAAAIGDMSVVAAIDTPGYVYSVAVDQKNNYLYVADGPNGLVIIDLDPGNTGNSLTTAALLSIGTYIEGSSYNLRSIILDNGGSSRTNPSYAYLAYGSKGVVILDVTTLYETNPTSPMVTDIYPGSGLVEGEAYDLTYTSDSTSGSDTLYVAMSYGTVLG